MRVLSSVALFALTAIGLVGCTGNEGPATVVSMRETFGECAGWCVTVLGFDGTATVDGQVEQVEGGVHENDVLLTAAGLAKLAEAEEALRGELVTHTYGCPDCDDGGAREVVVNNDAGQVVLSWEPHFSDLPAGLVALDELGDGLFQAVRACAEDDLVELPEDCTGTPR